MKALTIKQPYATLIMNGTKRYEMRNWKPKALDCFAVHAAAKPIDVVDLLNMDMPTEYWDGLYQPLGCILGYVKVVNYIDTTKMADSLRLHWNNALHPLTLNGKSYRWAWELEVFYTLKTPYSITGKQGLWDFEVAQP